MIKDALIRFARKVVENVLSQLMQQLNVVQENAFNPMQMMVKMVMDGVWVGRGADRFVEEVQNIMMPGVGRISDTMGTFGKNIQNAVNVIDEADEQVSNAVNALADRFGSIY